MELKYFKIPAGWAFPVDGRLSFGAILNHDDVTAHADGFNIWIDEIAVARERIGCAK